MKGDTGAAGINGVLVNRASTYVVTVPQVAYSSGTFGTSKAFCKSAKDILLTGGCTLSTGNYCNHMFNGPDPSSVDNQSSPMGWMCMGYDNAGDSFSPTCVVGATAICIHVP